jgi:hypothetical protein
MILRVLEDDAVKEARLPKPDGSASEVFIETEKSVHPPCIIVLQADHSRLAGDLARALSSEPFGDFPAEVIEAAAEHDFGWTESDRCQMQNLNTTPPKPFPRLSFQESQPSWDACINHGRSLSPLVDALISRHFTTLASEDPARRDFREAETSRREKLEAQLPYSSGELERWAGIVGFCDLLSLYLCSGATETVEFPLAHPASKEAKNARKVTLSWTADGPRFSTPLMKDGAAVSLSGSIYEGTTPETTSIDYTWSFS